MDEAAPRAWNDQNIASGEEAAIERRRACVTNAVKHFKWDPHGRRRIHKKRSLREIHACRPWQA